MITVEQILTTVDKHLKKYDEDSKSYKVLLSLREDIAIMEQPKSEEDDIYRCSICGRSPVKLKDGKYCLDCFDKYID